MAKSSLFFFHQGFRAGLWDFSPNSLVRCLETVLKPIAVPFKFKIARSSLASALLSALLRGLPLA